MTPLIITTIIIIIRIYNTTHICDTNLRVLDDLQP